MTFPWLLNLRLPEYPTVPVRAADFVHGGAVAVMLTPGHPCVTLDDHRLDGIEARSLGMATGKALTMANESADTFPVLDSPLELASGIVVGAIVIGDVLTMYLDVRRERSVLWCGPLSHGIDLGIALLAAGAGALDVDEYQERPIYIVTPIDPDGLSPFAARHPGIH